MRKKQLKKKDFLKILKNDFDISDEKILLSAANEIGYKCDKFSIRHYKILKNAILDHLNTLDDSEKKIYLNLKTLSYSQQIQNISLLNWTIHFISAGTIFSLFNPDLIALLGKATTLFFIIVLLSLLSVKFFVIPAKNFPFTLSVLKDIQNNF